MSAENIDLMRAARKSQLSYKTSKESINLNIFGEDIGIQSFIDLFFLCYLLFNLKISTALMTK